jgi:hypothetical protein
MKTLNERYQYGLNLFLLSIDEGITGYRDDSLEVSTNGLLLSQPYRIHLDHIIDRQAQSTTIRHASQDSLVRRAVRMDNGPRRFHDWKEE